LGSNVAGGSGTQPVVSWRQLVRRLATHPAIVVMAHVAEAAGHLLPRGVGAKLGNAPVGEEHKLSIAVASRAIESLHGGVDMVPGLGGIDHEHVGEAGRALWSMMAIGGARQ